MNEQRISRKKILASALLTTGLLGSAPLFAEETAGKENLPSGYEQVSSDLETKLCSQQFRCSKTGLLVHFLPQSKALFIHPDFSETLNADYTVRFNRHIVMNIYQNPSKTFDVIMRNVTLNYEGFLASVNQQERYFQKV